MAKQFDTKSKMISHHMHAAFKQVCIEEDLLLCHLDDDDESSDEDEEEAQAKDSILVRKLWELVKAGLPRGGGTSTKHGVDRK